MSKIQLFATIGGILLGISLLCFLFMPVHDTLTVKSFSWEYTMNIEEYKTVKDSGWDVPDGGRVYNSYKKKRDTKTVVVGYDSDGKPITEEQDVYDIWYEYEIEKWKFKTNIITCGTDRNPYFREYNFYKANPNTNTVGDEREGSRKQKYFIHGIDDKNLPITMEIDGQRWHELEIGGKIEVSHLRFGDNVLSLKYS